MRARWHPFQRGAAPTWAELKAECERLGWVLNPREPERYYTATRGNLTVRASWPEALATLCAKVGQRGGEQLGLNLSIESIDY